MITALLFASLLAIGLGTYLSLTRGAFAQAQRTFLQNDAHNLAEAGLEEALFCFRKVSEGTATATAWGAWTLNGADATYTLPGFNRDANAVGVVKVFVRGYNGSSPSPYILSQAIVTPFDQGAPIVRTLRLTLRRNAYFLNGIVGLEGLTWNGHPSADSFNSNPSNSPDGPWAPYTSSVAKSNTSVTVLAGTVNLGAQGLVMGSLNLGKGVSSPNASQVTGSIVTNVASSYPLPTYPTAASVSRSYSLGATVPATLPVSGRVAASDGNYYYFCDGAEIGATTITAGKNVVLVGTHTSMGSGLTVQATGSCKIYMDGTVKASGKGAINNESWAGALQIFTSTSGNCVIGGNGEIYACLYAPNASLTGNGGGNSGMLVGSFVARTITSNGHMDFHYDEALRQLSAAGAWKGDSWYSFQSSADRGTVSALSNGFLQ